MNPLRPVSSPWQYRCPECLQALRPGVEPAKGMLTRDGEPEEVPAVTVVHSAHHSESPRLDRMPGEHSIKPWEHLGHGHAPSGKRTEITEIRALSMLVHSRQHGMSERLRTLAGCLSRRSSSQAPPFWKAADSTPFHGPPGMALKRPDLPGPGESRTTVVAAPARPGPETGLPAARCEA